MKRLGLILVLFILLNIFACQSSYLREDTPAQGLVTEVRWALPEKSGYRLALRGTINVKTASSVIPFSLDAKIEATSTLRVVRNVSTVVCAQLTLEKYAIEYDKRHAALLAPMIRRISLPKQGTQIKIWIDATSGEIISYDAGAGPKKITQIESSFLGLFAFPLVDEFVPARIELVRPWAGRIAYTQRKKILLDQGFALTSQLLIESDESPLPTGQVNVTQFYSLKPGRVLASKAQASLSTRTRVPAGGVRFVMPLAWTINWTIEYVPL